MLSKTSIASADSPAGPPTFDLEPGRRAPVLGHRLAVVLDRVDDVRRPRPCRGSGCAAAPWCRPRRPAARRTASCCRTARVMRLSCSRSRAISVAVAGGEPVGAAVDDDGRRQLALLELLGDAAAPSSTRRPRAGTTSTRSPRRRRTCPAGPRPTPPKTSRIQAKKTIHLPRRVPGKVRRRLHASEGTSGSRRAALRALRDRSPAAGRRSSRRRRRRARCGPAEQRHGVRRRRPRPPARGRSRDRTTRASAPSSSPTSATSRTGLRWKSSAWSRWPNAVGCFGASSWRSWSWPSAAAS